MENFYTSVHKRCKNPENAVIMGILPPKPVDNRVESVDFCMEDSCIYSPVYAVLT